MTGPDMSKPGPSAEPGAYDETQLRDVSKLDLNKQDPVDDFTPAPTPDVQPPSTPYVAPGAISQPSHPGYPVPPSYPAQQYPAQQYPAQQYPQAGYPGQPPYGAMYPGYGYAPTTTNSKAVVSMILSILGVTFTCGLLGIPGLVLGYIAKREIDAANGTQDGSGMALAGIILGWLCVVGIAAFIVLMVIGIAAGA